MKTKKKPRVHSLEFKNKVVDEIERGELTGAAAMKKYSLASSVVFAWQRKRRMGALGAVPNGGGGRFSVTPEQKAAAIAELEAGGNAKAIAKRLGVSDAAVYWWRKKASGGEYPSSTARRKGNGHGKAVVVAEPVQHRIPQVAAQSAMRDATIFLRKGKAELMAGIRNGTIDDLDPVHLLSLLALKSLQGGA